MSLILSVGVILGLLLIPAVPGMVAAQELNCGMEVQPSTTKVVFNNTFDVEIVVINTVGQNMTGFDCYVEFDTSMIEVISLDTPGTLPNGEGPDMNPDMPDYNNTEGWFQQGFTTGTGDPPITENFTMLTAHLKSKGVAGTTSLDITVDGTFHPSDVLDPSGDHLNWTMVVDGTVVIGVPQLVVNVTPQAWTGASWLGMGGIGIGFNITWIDYPGGTIDVYEFIPYLPTTPFPVTTSWNWGDWLLLAGADMIPGWEFNTATNFTPTVGIQLPVSLLEYMGQNVTIYPCMILPLNALWTNTTAPFVQKAPAIFVAPGSLSFEAFEGINPSPDGLFLVNSGGGTLDWTATIPGTAGISNKPKITPTLSL